MKKYSTSPLRADLALNETTMLELLVRFQTLDILSGKQKTQQVLEAICEEKNALVAVFESCDNISIEVKLRRLFIDSICAF